MQVAASCLQGRPRKQCSTFSGQRVNISRVSLSGAGTTHEHRQDNGMHIPIHRMHILAGQPDSSGRQKQARRQLQLRGELQIPSLLFQAQLDLPLLCPQNAATRTRKSGGQCQAENSVSELAGQPRLLGGGAGCHWHPPRLEAPQLRPLPGHPLQHCCHQPALAAVGWVRQSGMQERHQGRSSEQDN